MKINLNELSKQAIESTTGSKKMRLSENASSMVFQLFTKNVYSNPIGTVVREITSNCFDSHIEANVNSPVIIRKNIDEQTGELSISFIDFGVGMSVDRIENIYGVYFESTKRVDNTQIGGFGIGGKTPLAYKRSTGAGEGEYDNSFYVITVFDNIKYYYCMYEGTDSPVISLLHSEPTTEHNGTEVRIPVLARDVDKFTKEMVKQLYYFENIIFEDFDEDSYADTLTNTYQIVRGKNFLYRGDRYDGNIHICLGKVAYPIDFGVLGLNSYDYKLPIALRLEVGDANVTVSREAIDYSEATIKMLKAKLEAAKNEIVELLNKQYSHTCSLRDYFDLKNDFGKIIFANGVLLYVGNLIKHDKIKLNNFAYNDLRIPAETQMFEFFFNTKAYGKINRWKNNFQGGYNNLLKVDNVLYADGDFNRVVIKQAYLKSEYENYYIITKRDILDDPQIDFNLKSLFGLQYATDGQMQTVYRMQDEYFDIVKELAIDYESVDVPQSFIDSRKRSRTTLDADVAKTIIPVTFSYHNSRESVVLGDLFKSNVQVFYGTQEDETTLYNSRELFDLLFDEKLNVTSYNRHNDYVKFYSYNSSSSRRDDKGNSDKGVMFIQIAKNNVKYMKYCKNAHHVNEFNMRMLYRKEDLVKKCFESRDVLIWCSNVRDFYKDKHFDTISPIWANKIQKVLNYAVELSTDIRTDIRNSKELLEKYYDLTNIKSTKDELLMKKEADEINTMIEANHPMIKYIRLPYELDGAEPELIALLKRLMVF